MSFFDRQGVPESLLHRFDNREDGTDINLKGEADIDVEIYNNGEFEDDVSTLTSYSRIKKIVKND